MENVTNALVGDGVINSTVQWRKMVAIVIQTVASQCQDSCNVHYSLCLLTAETIQEHKQKEG